MPEREQPYDMYDVIIQVFIMDGLEFDKHGEMIYENTQMDRLTAYILEVLASLNHRWLCDFDYRINPTDRFIVRWG